MGTGGMTDALTPLRPGFRRCKPRVKLKLKGTRVPVTPAKAGSGIEVGKGRRDSGDEQRDAKRVAKNDKGRCQNWGKEKIEKILKKGFTVQQQQLEKGLKNDGIFPR